jgi:hypothetical protein
MDFNNIYTNSNKESGATAVIIALLLFVFIGLAAFVVDLGFLYASRAELQNAADAGALAGARVLYKSDGKTLNVDPSPDGAIFVAANTAKQNKSANSIVEVDPNLDVKRGLWSFGEGNLSRGFYSDMTSTTAVAIWKYSEQELDQNKDKDGKPLKDANGNTVGFINAVQVTAHRDATPVRAFFSKIFGNDGFKLSATSVGYLGFAGGVVEIDQPIAVCEDAVMKDGLPICNIGRMSDSRTTKEKEDDGSNPEDLANTGGWTDLVECDPTSSGGKAVDGTMSACNLESTPIALYSGIRTTGGVQNVTFSTGSDSFYKCWLGTPPTIPTEPWSITLPVVECPNNNLGTCSKLVGTIKVDVMWILPKKSDDSPSEMTDPGNDQCPQLHTRSGSR